MCQIFLIGTATDLTSDKSVIAGTVHSYNQHVHIVVAEIAGIGLFSHLRDCQICNGFPVILNIPGRTIGMRSGRPDPVVGSVSSPVTCSKQDFSATVL